MEIKTAKVAISLPKDTFLQVERLRRELGLARSAAVLQALLLWLERRREQELEARYVRGYARKPESPAEAEPLFRAGLAGFTPEKW
jgi:metal-responsive CopG/Arc/MetJ family transcriptional regulator